MNAPIVVGYEDTNGSKAALAEAISFASDLSAPLVIVFGYQPPTVEREAKDYRDMLEEIGERATKDAVGQAKDGGVEAEAVLVAERPADALIKVAEERDARAIVVGSSGERPLTGAILGSVPHKLLHQSERPVVVVRMPKS